MDDEETGVKIGVVNTVDRKLLGDGLDEYPVDETIETLLCVCMVRLEEPVGTTALVDNDAVVEVVKVAPPSGGE